MVAKPRSPISDMIVTAPFSGTSIFMKVFMTTSRERPTRSMVSPGITSPGSPEGYSGTNPLTFIRGCPPIAASMLQTRPMWSISSDHLGPDGGHLHRETAALLRSQGYHVKEVGQQYLYAW